MSENIEKIASEKRFLVQVYNIDTDQENPVLESYAIGCPDGESGRLLYETLQRILQVLTHKTK